MVAADDKTGLESVMKYWSLGYEYAITKRGELRNLKKYHCDNQPTGYEYSHEKNCCALIVVMGVEYFFDEIFQTNAWPPFR